MAFILALIACALAVPAVIRLSPRWGLIDFPVDDPLKVHTRAVPRSGGVALGVALVATFPLVRPPLGVWAAGLIALLLGLADDRAGIKPGVRLLVQSGLGLMAGQALVGSEGWIRVALAAGVIVIAINAANLFDGLDGLLPLTGALTAAGLAVIGDGPIATLLWALSGSLVGFLFYNRPPARIFLGDGGSYLVGYVLGVGLISLVDDPISFVGGVLAFGFIGLDLLLTVVRRFRQRRPLFIGDRNHLYDRLADRSWPMGRILLVTGSLQAIFVSLGIIAGRA